MKHGKQLQRWMKVLLTKQKLNYENWLYVKNETKKLTVVHKYTLKPREIRY